MNRSMVLLDIVYSLSGSCKYRGVSNVLVGTHVLVGRTARCECNKLAELEHLPAGFYSDSVRMARNDYTIR